jgi:hypothetical protein
VWDLPLVVVAALYVVAMALPFVPAIEIGLALMLLLGETGVVLVYLCTQIALALSYLAGRWVPRSAMARAFARLGMRHARRLVENRDIEALACSLPSKWAPVLRRHPAIALAALLNLPGNALIGGAGGIAMMAGMNRLLPFSRYLVLVAAATAPLPLVLLLR